MSSFTGFSTGDVQDMADRADQRMLAEQNKPAYNAAEYLKQNPPERPAGQKYDGQGDDGSSLKPRWELLPIEEIEEIANVMTLGAEKYGAFSWQYVTPRDRYLGAAYRHLAKWMRGEKIDKEFGTPTLAHACCCLLFLMHFDRENEKNVK